MFKRWLASAIYRGNLKQAKLFAQDMGRELTTDEVRQIRMYAADKGFLEETLNAAKEMGEKLNNDEIEILADRCIGHLVALYWDASIDRVKKILMLVESSGRVKILDMMIKRYKEGNKANYACIAIKLKNEIGSL